MIDEGILLGALYGTTQTKLTCTVDGKLRVDAVATIVGSVDISDKPTRQLGLVYGSQGEQLLQRAASFDLEVQLRTGGAEYDARQIRSLAKATDEVYGVLRTDAGVAYDGRDRNWNLGALDVPDLSDRWARQVGQFDLARVLGAALTSANPIIAGIFDAAGNRMPAMDAVARPGYMDMIDRAGRLAGIVYGNVGQLQQRAVSGDAYIQLRTAGVEYDARDRNWALGAGDVPDLSDRAARLVGRVDFPITNPVTSQLIGAATYGLGIGLFDALGNRMPAMDAVARPGYVDPIDRAARLLGVVYGSQAQQLQQKAATFELMVAANDLDIRNLAKATDEVYSVLRTDAGVAYDARDRSWTLGAGDVPDLSDRAARLLGVVYGSQSQQLLQRAVSFDLQVQLRTAGTEYDARQIRALAKATDEVYSVLRTDAGVAYDAREIRALVSTDVLGVVDATGNRLPSMDVAARPGFVDVIDRAARLLGIAYGNLGQLDQRLVGARNLATVNVEGYLGVAPSAANPFHVTPGTGAEFDVSDRAARLLGKVYGDQGIFTQRAVSLDAQVQLRTAGVEYDASQIRALISTDVLGVVDAAGNRMPSMDVAARPGFVDVIDRAARLLGIAYGESAQLQQGTPADAYANPANVLEALGFLMGWNSASWDRIRTADALANATAGAGVTLKNYHNDELGILPSLALGYDDTLDANAFRALAVDASGRLECVTP